MQTVIVYCKPTKVQGKTVNQEVGQESIDHTLELNGARDYLVRDGKLWKVLEKVANLDTSEMRILVRES